MGSAYSPLGADSAAYWEISVEEAGRTIFAGIQSKSKKVYVPSKVWIACCLLKWLPDWLYNNYFSWL
jgi:hypothetical protein